MIVDTLVVKVHKKEKMRFGGALTVSGIDTDAVPNSPRDTTREF